MSSSVTRRERVQQESLTSREGPEVSCSHNEVLGRNRHGTELKE